MTIPEPVRCPRCGAPLPRHYPPCRATKDRMLGRSGRPIGAPQGELVALRTQDEVAQMLGVTRGAVQQIEARALRKLRRLFTLAGLAPEGWR